MSKFLGKISYECNLPKSGFRVSQFLNQILLFLLEVRLFLVDTEICKVRFERDDKKLNNKK